MTTALYLIGSSVLLALFGSGIAFHPSLRDLGRTARVGLAYLIGAFALAIEATAYSILRLPWSPIRLALPLLALSVGLALIWSRFRPAANTVTGLSSRRVALAALTVGVLAIAHLAIALATSYSSSVDFVLFFGAKAVRFAHARAIDSNLLGYFFFYHGAPWYPPLTPIIDAWGILIAGKMPWRFVPLISLIWFLAGAAPVISRLRARLGPDRGSSVGAFWIAAMGVSLAHSCSGGNAEAPLLAYIGLAGVWLLTEQPGESRLVPVLSLAGAAFCKQEGLLVSLAIAFGTLARDILQKRRGEGLRALPLIGAPLLTVGLWFLYQSRSGLSIGYRSPTNFSGLDLSRFLAMIPDFVRNLNAGTYGLSWIVPLLFLVVHIGRARTVLPGVLPAAAVFAALLVVYTGETVIDRTILVTNTLNRACQPALSLLILSAGVAAFAAQTASRGAAPLRIDSEVSIPDAAPASSAMHVRGPSDDSAGSFLVPGRM